MQSISMLEVIGITAMIISTGSAQLNSITGCVPFDNNPVTCTFSWIFFSSEESASDDSINAFISTSSCETLVEGSPVTQKLGVNATIPASMPGLTLPLRLTNGICKNEGPVFHFNGTRYDAANCTCGVGRNISAATGYACSCPFVKSHLLSGIISFANSVTGLHHIQQHCRLSG